jgi:RimJ/RimL family protein N-acetyltransferase
MSTSTCWNVRPLDVSYPVLSTRRFKLRPFTYSDIRQLTALAGTRRVADTALGVPHPYTAEFARKWISSHPRDWVSHRALHWAAVEMRSDADGRLLGYTALDKVDFERRQAELLCWVGYGVERKGYAIEWCLAVLEFAVDRLALNRIYALQLARHPFAGHVLAALGMREEGLVRKRIAKEGLLEDFACWGITPSEIQRRALRADFLAHGDSIPCG